MFSNIQKYGSMSLLLHFMNEESAFSQASAPVPTPNKRKRLILIFLIVLILLVIGLVALYIIGGTIKRPTPVAVTPAPTALPTLIPTETPDASVSAVLTASQAGTLRVSIQNGSGIPGAAQKYATSLKAAGYTQVTTGNADKFDYKGITLFVNQKTKLYLTQLEKDILKASASGAIKSSVDDTIKTDVQIIIGK